MLLEPVPVVPMDVPDVEPLVDVPVPVELPPGFDIVEETAV